MENKLVLVTKKDVSIDGVLLGFAIFSQLSGQYMDVSSSVIPLKENRCHIKLHTVKSVE